MPRCPKCGEEINGLSVLEICRREVWLLDDKIVSEWKPSKEKISYRFYCPKCNMQLFTDWESAKNFLEGKTF